MKTACRFPLNASARSTAGILGAVAALCAGAEAWSACPGADTGITATGSGVTRTEAGCTVSTTSPLRYGISANNQAQATLNGGSVRTTGLSAHGIYALNGGTASMNNGAVTASGHLAIGAYALNSNATINLSAVTFDLTGVGASGSNGVGLNATDTGRIFGTGLAVNTRSDNGHGASTLRNGVVDLSASTVNTLGTASYGISAGDTAQITVRNGSIVTTAQNYNHAAYAARNSQLAIDRSSVSTAGTGAYGVYARDTSTANVLNQSSIATTGSGAYGLIAQSGSRINLADSRVTTAGASAIGAYAYSGSRIDLVNGSVTTTGGNAHAFYSVAGAGVTNTLNASSSTLSAGNGAALYANGGITNISLAGSRAGSGSNLLLQVNSPASVESLYDLDGLHAEFGPTGNLVQLANVAANPSTLNLVADASTLTGNSSILGAATANVTLRNATVLTGAVATAAGSTTNFLHQGGSTWNMTASSNVTNLSNEASTINFSAPAGGVFKTLATVNYAGAGGTLGLNTQLGADGSPSDRLVINGGSAGGSSLLRITNAGGTGAQTTGNGILVVDAANAATTGANAFALAAPAVAGVYDYGLARGSMDASAPQSWFLRSTRIRPETSLYAVLPALGILYGGKLLDSLDERWGEETPWNGVNTGMNSVVTGLRVAALETGQGMGAGMGEPEPRAPDGFWGRVIGQHGKRDDLAQAFPNGSPKYAHDFYALQAGLDVYRSERHDGHKEHAGVYGAIGYGKGKVTHFDGSDAGENSFNAYTLGGYWTHFGPSNWYLDGIVQATWYDAKGDGKRGLPELKTKGMGYAASLEGGYPLRLESGWLVEPQAQLIFGRLDLRDGSDAGGNVSFRDGDSLVGRLGVRIGRTRAPDEKRDPTASIGWVRLSVLHEFYGEPKVVFNGLDGPIPFRTSLDGNWWEAKAGLTKQFERGRFLYASLGYQKSFDRNSYAYDVKVGLRIEW